MKEDVIEKYPFLRKGLVQYFGEGISLQSFLEDNEYFLKKSADLLYGIMSGEEVSFPVRGEERVKEYIITKIILTYIRDYFISARYAIRERKVLYDTLEKEEDVRNLKSVSHELNVEIEKREEKYLIPIPSFLKNAVVFNDKELKLCNQELKDGNVVASKHVLSKIIREAFYRKYMQEVNEVVEFPKDVEKMLRPFVSEVISKGEEIRQERAYLGPLNEKSFPPCLVEIISQMKKGVNVSHPGRFYLVTFLHRIGLPNDEIIKYFGDVPDFAEKITKYQIEHITGTGRGREYSVPSCQTLASLGLCYKERDPLCNSGKITHPLNFYRIKNLGNRPVGKTGPIDRVDKSRKSEK
jgi:DNA primase large subunit